MWSINIQRGTLSEELFIMNLEEMQNRLKVEFEKNQIGSKVQVFSILSKCT